MSTGSPWLSGARSFVSYRDSAASKPKPARAWPSTWKRCCWSGDSSRSRGTRSANATATLRRRPPSSARRSRCNTVCCSSKACLTPSSSLQQRPGRISAINTWILTRHGFRVSATSRPGSGAAGARVRHGCVAAYALAQRPPDLDPLLNVEFLHALLVLDDGGAAERGACGLWERCERLCTTARREWDEGHGACHRLARAHEPTTPVTGARVGRRGDLADAHGTRRACDRDGADGSIRTALPPAP